MSVRLLNAAEPYLYIRNAFAFPLVGPPKKGDSDPVVLTSISLAVTVGILLQYYLDAKVSGRSLAEEQVEVYEAVAEKLHTQFDLDGRACVLRFICELQQGQLGHSTVAGKILTVLFTPHTLKTKGQPYLAAKGLGRRKDAACASHYSSCPHSVFLYFETLRNLTTTNPHNRHS
ncbi:uncharacterized protein LOC135091217 [Scylla paramamosain]|uniref:uncharacterized protein LOC135091217 n=1 Tax=Scylla paramamosain TaxID=85552 RepID=UPI0030834467